MPVSCDCAACHGRTPAGNARVFDLGRPTPVRNGLSAGGRWIRTIGPWRHAVGSVMENVDNLAEPAGRLSQSTTLAACYVTALVKGSMAWLLCLPVGQALPLASSYRSTLFCFGEGPTVRIRFPPAESPQTIGSSAAER